MGLEEEIFTGNAIGCGGLIDWTIWTMWRGWRKRTKEES